MPPGASSSSQLPVSSVQILQAAVVQAVALSQEPGEERVVVQSTPFCGYLPVRFYSEPKNILYWVSISGLVPMAD